MTLPNQTESSSDSFYSDLRSFTSAVGVADLSYFEDCPASWHVVVVDIRGSTKAIQAGRYREVNTVGAAAIAAVCNSWDARALPYVFGGDGATFLVPGGRLEATLSVLGNVAKMANSEFGLELRVGSTAVSDVYQKGYVLKLAKRQLAEGVFQAVFVGGGLSHAEKLIKSAEAPAARESTSQANFDGLECRWQPVSAQRGEILSVLIRTQTENLEQSCAIYQELVEEIELVTGGSKLSNPVPADALKLTANPEKLMVEHRIKHFTSDKLTSLRHLIVLVLQSLIGRIVLGKSLKIGGFDWGAYKRSVVENSDFWKFDDMLRFVIDVSPISKRALMACLDTRFRRGEIFYGVHSSPAALVTCLVFDRAGEHIHFVDGTDGGFAQAAVQLKAQIASSDSKLN